jgi:hypothetical protein
MPVMEGLEENFPNCTDPTLQLIGLSDEYWLAHSTTDVAAPISN